VRRSTASAQGEIVRVLLSRPELKELRVVVLNPGVARTSLARCGADWLADPRIELRRTDARSEVEAALHGVAGRPRARERRGRAPARPRAARARDAVPAAAAGTSGKRAPQARGRERGALPRRPRRVDPLRLALRRRPVRGRGRTEPRAALRRAARPRGRPGRRRRGAEAAARGRRPSRPTSSRRIRTSPACGACSTSPSSALGATTLVYFPVVAPEVLAGWKGPRRVARGPSPLYDGFRGGRVAELFSSGSSCHPSVDLHAGSARGASSSSAQTSRCPAARATSRERRGRAGARAPPRAGCSTATGAACPSQPNLVGYLRDLERWLEASGAPCRNRDRAAQPPKRAANPRRAAEEVGACRLSSWRASRRRGEHRCAWA
jgi:hypothetical protein